MGPGRFATSDDVEEGLYVHRVVDEPGGDLPAPDHEVTKDAKDLGSYRLIDVSQVCLYGNVTVTAQVMRELFAREIPICWFS